MLGIMTVCALLCCSGTFTHMSKADYITFSWIVGCKALPCRHRVQQSGTPCASCLFIAAHMMPIGRHFKQLYGLLDLYLHLHALKLMQRQCMLLY